MITFKGHKCMGFFFGFFLEGLFCFVLGVVLLLLFFICGVSFCFIQYQLKSVIFSSKFVHIKILWFVNININSVN